MSATTCDSCGKAFPTAAGKRYCSKRCASAFWRLHHPGQETGRPAPDGTATWRTMRGESPDKWDQQTQYSPSAFLVEKHAATCMACSRIVEPVDPVAWRNAVLTRRCEHCHGLLLIEVQDAGALSSPSEVRIRIGKRVA